MGYDAVCTLRYDGKSTRGTASLEHKDLVFRGPVRLAIPLRDITEARAKDGTLLVAFGDRQAAFEIGVAADKWAARITNPPSRVQKLGVKPGMRIAMVGVPDEGLETELKAAGAEVLRRAPTAAGRVDMLFFGAARRDDLARATELSKAIKPDGAFWVIRPKGQAALTERDTMAWGKTAGLVDVKVVSFSETHSAEKYVVPRARRPEPGRTGVIPLARRAGAARSSTPSPRTRRSAASRARN